MVGVMYIAPPFLIWGHLNSAGKPFVLAQLSTYKDELTVYLPRAREVYDGHLLARDLYFNEPGPTVLNILPTWFFSIFIYLFSGNINLAYLSAQFFFIAVIFILLFRFGLFLFGNSKPWALFFGLTGVLTPMLFSNYRIDLHSPTVALKDLISLSVKQFVPIVHTQIHKMFLARVDDPLLTYPIYISAIFSFIAFWRNPKTTRAVLAGLLAGLLFYTYFHYWIYWMIFLGVAGVYALFFQKKDFIIKYVVLAGVVALVSVPYFINYFTFVHTPGSLDYSLRLGLSLGHESYISDVINYYILYIILALGIGAVVFKRNRSLAILFWLLLLAAILSWNIQLILGKMFVYWQVGKAIAPLIFIMLFYICYVLVQEIYKGHQGLKKIMVAMFLVLAISLVSKKVVNVISIYFKPDLDVVSLYRFSDNLNDSFSWLGFVKEPEPRVVSSSLVTSLYLTTYTSSRPFLATGFASPVSTKILEDRYLLANKMFGVDSAVLERRLERGLVGLEDCQINCPPDSWNNLHKDVRYLYVNYFLNDKVTPQPIPEQAIPEKNMMALLEHYAQLTGDWNNIGPGYVYYGPWEKEFSQVDLAKEEKLKLAYKNPSVAIYKIIK